jgi:hypothetical protein
VHRLILWLLLLGPQLRISAPPELVPIQKKLEAIDPARYADIAQTVGLADTGAPIQVVLAPETSEVARDVPSWVAGFASTPDEMIVLFPSRTPGYPNGSLEDVLRHEVAHVWIGRASAERPIPRWFNEGLAMSVERGWRLVDEGQFVYQLALGSRPSLTELDRMFGGSQSDQTRAYALSGALVHDVLQRNGSGTGAAILSRMHDGASFDHAFEVVVGRTPAEAESDFWDSQRLWTSWLPLLTSSTTLWLAITGLALLAIARRIMKNRAIERKWEEEDRGIDESDHYLN